MVENKVAAERGDENAELISALVAWRHNRRLYPGWLVAPSETRARVWRTTQEWLFGLTKRFGLGVSDDWSAPQQLVLWRELAWRCETSLCPLPDEYVDHIQSVLDHLREVLFGQGDGKPPLFKEDVNWPETLSPSASELRKDFQAVQLSLLRSYRLRPDVEAFERCALDIERISGGASVASPDLQYQRCLRALAELDWQNARDYLETWSEDSEDPYWLVRKASINLELGELEVAKSLAADALQKIRLQRRHDGAGFYALSREGWCRRFLWQIGFSEDRKAAEIPLRLVRELERFRCSPDRELSQIADRLKGRPPPEPLQRSQWGEPDFDSGARTETHRLHGDHPYFRLFPAIELLLLIEETGIPPALSGKVLNTTFMNNADVAALSWIQSELPGIWFAYALRFGERGLSDKKDGSRAGKVKALGRTALAVLPQKHVKRLFSAIMQEIDRLMSQGVQQSSSSFNAMFRQRDLFDAATRLSTCLKDEEREWILTIGLKLADSAIRNSHPAAIEPVLALVKRIVPHLSVPLVQKWLPDLVFRFPMANNAIGNNTLWPIITDYIRFSAGQIQRPDEVAFAAGVTNLITIISAQDIEKRTDAAVRILSMYKWELLTTAEVEKFTAALWRRTNETGLPEVSPSVIVSVHLEWPQNPDSNVIDGLKNWIQQETVKDRFEPSPGLNSRGEPQRSIRFPDPDTYLQQLSSLFIHSLANGTFKELFGQAQREHICTVIFEWWERERSSYEAEVERDRLFDNGPFDRLQSVLKILFFCCCQGDLGDEKSTQIKAFNEDCERMIGRDSYTRMVHAVLSPQQLDSFWKRVHLDIWDTDAEKSSSTLYCLWIWEKTQPLHGLVGAPVEVIEALAASLTDASVSAHRGYDVMTALLSATGEEARAKRFWMLPTFIDIAAHRLSYEGVAQHTVNPEMQSHLRRRLAALICAMYKHEIPVGDTAKQWLVSAKSDPFVDVRSAASEFVFE